MFADLLLDSAFAKAHRPVSKSDEPAHPIRAAEAACDLGAFTEIEVRGRKLRTRIGVNSYNRLTSSITTIYTKDFDEVVTRIIVEEMKRPRWTKHD